MHAPEPRRNARPVAHALFAIALLGFAWALTVSVVGPIRFRLLGLLVSTDDPWRPLAVAILALAAMGWLRGWANVRAALPSGWRHWARLPSRAWQRISRLDDRILAVVIALVVMAVGLSGATTSASGSDAYGYVSQADQWLEGDVTIDQSWAAEVPWPSARWTFTPLGWRPSSVPGELWTLTPVYAFGLPLMLAVAKLIGGHAAMFWVLPLCGAALVLATFGIGRRLGASRAGVIAALLVATSPAVLFMLMSPMSDLPVAAMWTLSFFFMLGGRGRSAWLAGLSAGLAILIRPNLVFGAAIFGFWYAWRVVRTSGAERRTAFLHGLYFSTCVVAAAVFVALFNDIVYGSPLLSGYGNMDGMFTRDHFWPNAKLYTGWLVETQSPMVLAGILALLIPVRGLWPGTTDRSSLFVMGFFFVAMWLNYCFYLVFTDWWYLRFLLATWPFMMLGCGVVIVAISRRIGNLAAFAATVLLIVFAVAQMARANDLHVFTLYREERRYPAVAKMVRRLTDRQSVFFSMQHSGSLRYYGGRMSIRYDMMERRWVDRSIEWLAERGIRSYLLVDEWELEGLTRMFAGTRALERIVAPPMVRYTAGAPVLLFDLTPDAPAGIPTRIVDENPDEFRNALPVPLVPPSLALPR